MEPTGENKNDTHFSKSELLEVLTLVLPSSFNTFQLENTLLTEFLEGEEEVPGKKLIQVCIQQCIDTFFILEWQMLDSSLIEQNELFVKFGNLITKEPSFATIFIHASKIAGNSSDQLSTTELRVLISSLFIQNADLKLLKSNWFVIESVQKTWNAHIVDFNAYTDDSVKHQQIYYNAFEQAIETVKQIGMQDEKVLELMNEMIFTYIAFNFITGKYSIK